MRPVMIPALALPLACALAACGDSAKLVTREDTGTQPVLAAPVKRAIPTVNIAPAVDWPEGATPVAAEGLVVAAFARGLDHPRWLYVLPNGDVLVAET
ncbi:MAG: sorbosone dehydrogenase family protein, partial [Luteimonas sp.]|nr:sorbosone dehydrogenase family protein [Luteimonas sp.]